MEESFSWVNWWKQNKRWVYPTVAFVVALAGGNVDRIEDFIPTSPDVNKVEVRVKAVEESVNTLTKDVSTLTKAVAAHEDKLNNQVQDKPLFRE